LPVLGRAVGLDDQGVGRIAPEDRSGLPRERIGRDRIAEREPVLRVEPVLVLGCGLLGAVVCASDAGLKQAAQAAMASR
jgi:hypothetical protein